MDERENDKKMTIKEFFESKDTLAIHCATKEKANKLLEAFDKAGYRWIAGNRYEGTFWDVYGEKTCYSNRKDYGDISSFKDDGYRILEFEKIELKDASFVACAEKVLFVPDKEEKRPQSMKEEKKAIEKTIKKCAEFFGITNCVCTYTYEYGANKLTLYTDKTGWWIGYHGNGVTILKAALSAALQRDNVEVAFIELKGIMVGSIKIGENNE